MRIALWFVLVAWPFAAQTAEARGPGVTTLVVAPGLSVDRERQELRIDAAMCLHRGIIEYLICRSGSFEHEALLSTSCQASRLHAALLLIGGTPFPFLVDQDWPARARTEPDANLEIAIEYLADGITQRRNIRCFLRNRERADGVVDGGWIFTGAPFTSHDGRESYAADASGALAGVTLRGGSVIQYGERLGVPYQGDYQGLEIDDTTAPPVGTQVRIIISRRAPERSR